ncbi:MAG: fumarylacetoacetate hydrolase family protein [Chloroflexi bacterium]|jgi:2-keto-4-pentenoate hydratase/2-oxohepta-3-ene-1,7-dioic acid hydratase in catechol pathway|nr:fumarylacetoacetate hydrolase family protein [Chloroflexota bacterium]MBT3668920.1 fumarylacetoacetate hydrolase family protein [Chloroflexota bacterium]MBT4001877.1 fumarylacetoacetate hydrolase family protein [Chloroflexota bacterium]MBT4305353.1 fumarylacetoacetate hydrolase family protein [Chloroflexota bacterium]MBT4532499.1 fumarylacetoacetate hydrolase family protein [Chloroflexota bacterium]
MRIIRFQHKKKAPQYGWILNDKVGQVEGSFSEGFRRLEADIELKEVQLLAPVQPSKIICVGRNYVAHAEEHGAEVPDLPLLFLKPPSTIIGPNDPIILPPQSEKVEHEAELALVIGKRGRWISIDKAFDHIFGYTIANDVTARDLQRSDKQWTRGKGFDTFCPVGPWIDTDFDPTDALVTCHVNDELRQMASTRDMVFPIRQIIAYASSVMTLEPGDLILTGTPAGVGRLSPSDQVTISIEGLGELINPVSNEERN